MTMEIELAKRDFVKQLWEETERDEAARDLIFGQVLESVSNDPPSDLRETLEKEMMEDPPDDLRKKVEADLIDDPPDALIEKVTELLLDDPPTRLVEKIKREIRDQMEQELSDQRDDLRVGTESLIEDLKAQITYLSERLAGNTTRKPTKVWR